MDARDDVCRRNHHIGAVVFAEGVFQLKLKPK